MGQTKVQRYTSANSTLFGYDIVFYGVVYYSRSLFYMVWYELVYSGRVKYGMLCYA